MTHTLWPRGVDRTEIVCEWLFHPDAMAAPGFDPDDAVAFWDLTNRQDWHVCEQMQLGLTSRAYRPGPYSHREELLVRLRPAHPRAASETRLARTPDVTREVTGHLGGSPIAADRLDGAFLEGGQAGGLLGGIAGLLEDVTSASRVVAREIQRGGLAAQVAVDAGDVDVVSAGDVFGNLVQSVGHGVRALMKRPVKRKEKGTAPADAGASPFLSSVLSPPRST